MSEFQIDPSPKDIDPLPKDGESKITGKKKDEPNKDKSKLAPAPPTSGEPNYSPGNLELLGNESFDYLRRKKEDVESFIKFEKSLENLTMCRAERTSREDLKRHSRLAIINELTARFQAEEKKHPLAKDILNELRPSAWLLLSQLAWAYDVYVTADKEGGHNTGSKHPLGLAIDTRTRLRSIDEINQWIDTLNELSLIVRDERVHPPGQRVWKGQHTHIEMPTPGIKNSRPYLSPYYKPGTRLPNSDMD